MKSEHRKRKGKPAVEIIEEATHLLRTAPGGALAAYYLGTVPFVLGGLYFWGDMSRNPFAYQHLAGAALGMTLLFLWMKCWQVIFARQLRAAISGDPALRWDFARCCRVFMAQAVMQGTGLFLLPIALLITLPAAWSYAFYQNLTALDDGEPLQMRDLFRKAARQARLWPGQNHTALLILSGFTLCVALSWGVVCYALPALGKMLFGLETVFTRSGTNLLNTTFFATIVGLTYLSLDPLLKAVYVLRCFYGEALESGADLKAELKRFSLQPLVASLLLALCLTGAVTGRAQESPVAVPPAPVSGGEKVGVKPTDLDQALDDVIQQRKYTWRLPREKVAELDNAESGPVVRFLKKIGKWTVEKVKAAAEWLGDKIEKLLRGLRFRPRSSSSGPNWMVAQQLLLYLLVIAVVLAVGFLIFRLVRGRRIVPQVVQSEAIQPVPDLTDENVAADQLPEDGWTKLARELLERGELRLALRAFYLASLAHLAQQNLISLARFKSNRDYERELQRRGHSFPTLLNVFGENIRVFDRIWYGMHDVTRDLVQQFASNVEKLKAGG